MSLRLVHLRNELIKIQKENEKIKVSEESGENVEQKDGEKPTEIVTVVQDDNLKTEHKDSKPIIDSEKEKISATKPVDTVEPKPIDAHLLPSNIHAELKKIELLYREAETTETG